MLYVPLLNLLNGVCEYWIPQQNIMRAGSESGLLPLVQYKTENTRFYPVNTNNK